MIAYLRGEVVALGGGQAVIDVGGVGYGVEVAEAARLGLGVGQQATFWVHTLVSEEALRLFGFPSLGERQAFTTLLGVGGVGPRLALGLVAALGPGGLAGALRAGDGRRLTQVSGVGRRTAERILLELKDRWQSFAASAPGPLPQAPGADLLSALVNLGFSPAAAEQAAGRALAEEGPGAGLPKLVRRALQLVAP